MATLVKHITPFLPGEGPGVRASAAVIMHPGATARTSPRSQPRQRGYTYLLVLFLVAGLGALTAGVGQTWQARAQREKEAELIGIGVEFSRALRRYQDTSPDAAQSLPQTLEVLVEDRRFPKPQRHLRRIYRDPMTGKKEWGIERSDAGITGVYSLSDKTPFRHHALPAALGQGASGAKSYRQWVFRPVDENPAAADTPSGGDARFGGLLRPGGAAR